MLKIIVYGSLMDRNAFMEVTGIKPEELMYNTVTVSGFKRSVMSTGINNTRGEKFWVYPHNDDEIPLAPIFYPCYFDAVVSSDSVLVAPAFTVEKKHLEYLKAREMAYDLVDVTEFTESIYHQKPATYLMFVAKNSYKINGLRDTAYIPEPYLKQCKDALVGYSKQVEENFNQDIDNIQIKVLEDVVLPENRKYN